MAVVSVALPASAASDVEARAAFARGELAERERRYDDAVLAYRDVLKIDPGNWFAGAARARLDVLALYEGNFAELAALDAIRRNPQHDRAAVEALAKLSAGWQGRVWGDAQLFVAEAFVGRFRDPARAIDPALAVARRGVDPIQRGAGWDLAYSAMRDDLDRAAREVHDAPAPIRTRVLRELRRRRLHSGATLIAGAGAGLGIFAVATAARRGRFALVRQRLFRPLALAFLVTTPLFAGLIAERWEHGMGAHFLPFGIALAGVHVFVATWRGAFGDRPRPIRLLGGLTAALCVLAAAYLVLERGEAYGTPLLEGFGL